MSAPRRSASRPKPQDTPSSARRLAEYPGHVLVPLSEWERLQLQDMVRESISILDDPKTEWIDVDQVIAGFAAPNIARLRRKRGLTQKQLGDKLGMPQSQISRMEKNPDAMTYKTLRRVAKALGVKVGELLG